MDNTTNWKPDPFGVHELRFFSADGKPTLLVMDGGTRTYDKPPTEPMEGPVTANQVESDRVAPPQSFTPAQTEPRAPTDRPVASATSEEVEFQGGKGESVSDPASLESLVVSEPQRSSASAIPLAPGPVSHAVPREGSQDQAPTLVGEPTMVGTGDQIAVGAPSPPSAVSSLPSADDPRAHQQEPMSHALKVAYGVVLGVLTLSALGVLFVHLHHSNDAHPMRAVAPTTTTTAPTKKASTVVLPSRLSPSAEIAADDLVTSWSTNNRLGALAVATSTAATTLFSSAYTSGLAIGRGCSTSFSPIVCTFGPPGGASPTDPIYEIRVSQVAGGWYVSSVRIEN